MCVCMCACVRVKLQALGPWGSELRTGTYLDSERGMDKVECPQVFLKPEHGHTHTHSLTIPMVMTLIFFLSLKHYNVVQCFNPLELVTGPGEFLQRYLL